ncbi:uncharacterized protein K444DRAFT_178416 [Hyaloscypha bicolor E]|uniref:BHLH domain-containing protein n=1 Tax=Hyaloscypha bicolor E TaxID=1095630 RepID=A0A2J6TQR6_9HELO|nr:uncharacterized protein K444DRAFT_178416 [Hyaloscypha bicolor E]PMD65364.1 hypothetical protein K444DRAFT_178416 [Hyaloscypha bicolor E]
MKSTAAYVGDLDHVRGPEREAPPHVSGTRPSTEFGDHDPADQVRQSDLIYGYTSSPVPSYFPFDTYPQDHRGQSPLFEWSTVYHTTARSNTQTRNQPFSIYGTSSDNVMADDLTYDPVLPPLVSSLGSHDIPMPFNSTTMVWERFPAPEDTNLNDSCSLHTTSQEHHQDLGDENELATKLELDPVLPMNSPSSSLSTVGDITESSATSECVSLEEPEMSLAKRRRVSAPSLRWNTTRKTRKKKLEQTTIVFPQSPTSSTPKTNHNAIEKQYRNRLNDKFEALLSVLPAQEAESEGGSLATVSKGDVLILAKDYIESLEKSRDELREDRRSLEDDVKNMKEAWIQSGGSGFSAG